jgi:hypothetical protein
MNFKSQALELSEFIRQTSGIWKDEILNQYPMSLEHYPKDWLALLESLSEEELHQVDSKIIIDKIKETPLAALMQKTKLLTDISKIPDYPELPLEKWAFNGVKKKKHHEIQKIVPVLKNIREQIDFEYIVDVGGGVGHLSRVLANYHGIPSVSLDRNIEFQKIGLERLKKYRKLENSADVEFINLNFTENEGPELLNKIFKPKAFSIGLHTCGALANSLINTTINQKSTGVLSFGCCYHLLDPKKDFPLSHFYKNQNLPQLNLYALTLATRAHSAMSFEDYRTKKRVKFYRYAIHLFLVKHFNLNQFFEVGECPVKIYWEPFSSYIKIKLEELKINHTFSDDEFDQFYQSLEIQKQLQEMFLCNIIRWQIGRVLEVYILVDRCLHLEENGYSVSLEQYFFENISPRNLGILGCHHPFGFAPAKPKG